MSKLEIKHVKGYLGTGVKVLMNDGEIYYLNLERHVYRGNDKLHSVNIEDVMLNPSKLILHPLSDLTKEIEHNGEKFVPLRELEILMNRYGLSIYPNLDITEDFNSGTFEYINAKVGYEIIEWLHEHHFDTNNLIENGLAIDINTLK